MQDKRQEPEINEEEQKTSLADIFGKDSKFDSDIEDEEPIKKEPVKTALKQTEEDDEQEEAPVVNKNEKQPKTNVPEEDNETGDGTNQLTQLRAELEKAEHRNKKTNSALSDASRKLKAFEKKVNKLLNDGVLQDDEAKSLLNETEHDEAHEIELETNPVNQLFKIANEGFSKIKASMEEGLLDEDPLFDKKANAFNAYWNDATATERQKLYDSLMKLDKEPIRMAKRMLSLGQEYYEEIYGELEEAGNLRSFKQKYQTQIEGLQKTIDKQEKQILKYKEQYEGFVPPKTMKLPTGGGKESPEEQNTSLGDIFKMSKAGALSRN